MRPLLAAIIAAVTSVAIARFQSAWLTEIGTALLVGLVVGLGVLLLVRPGGRGKTRSSR